jgi:hypothetical protein
MIVRVLHGLRGLRVEKSIGHCASALTGFLGVSITPCREHDSMPLARHREALAACLGDRTWISLPSALLAAMCGAPNAVVCVTHARGAARAEGRVPPCPSDHQQHTTTAGVALDHRHATGANRPGLDKRRAPIRVGLATAPSAKRHANRTSLKSGSRQTRRSNNNSISRATCCDTPSPTETSVPSFAARSICWSQDLM